MIEQMTHVAILSRMADREDLLTWLYRERGFHVMPIEEERDSWVKHFSALPDDTQAIDSRLTRINSVVSFCQEYCTNKPSFLDAMLPLKVVGSKNDISNAVEETDVDLLYEKTSEMRSGIEASNEKLTRFKSQKFAVEQFAFLGDDLPRITRLKHVVLEVVAASGQGGKAFLLDERITSGQIVTEELFADQTHTYYALVVPASEEDVLRSLIDDHGLHVHNIPQVKYGAQQEILLLNNEILEANLVLNGQKAEAAKFADAWLKKAGLAAGYWESEKNLAVARVGMAESKNLFVSRGYIKTEKVEEFKQCLESKLPGATIVACDAPEGEEPPISMKWSRWISPASLLVKMYGLPSYMGIDPTPYVASIFFIFVGICLGDAAYGIMLVLLMEWLKRKYKEQAGLRDFFQAFVYCGYTTIFFGLLYGSFFGDLPAKVPGFGWLDSIRTAFQVIDPIKDSQLALYIAVGIGVLTQLYGLALRVYRDLRRNDKMGAFADGVLWMCFLVFAILGGLTGSFFFWLLFVLTIVALVATQGRDQKSLFGRFFVGLVSLYGIVGSYGASGILGDLISYARLMALALTGAALGSTFNMLAEICVDIPGIGFVMAALVVVGGHLMNFFLNLLSGFVHSARLVMLEFFGRFYEAGGSPFRPYGFLSSTVEVKKD